MQLQTPGLWASGMSLIDKLGVLALAAVPKRLRRLHTSVELTEEAVRHETRLVVAGLTVLRTLETIELLPDGQRIRLRGRQRLAPLWRERDFAGHGEVREDSLSAFYELELLGAPLEQETQRSKDMVILEQKASWFTGRQQLQRVPRAVVS